MVGLCMSTIKIRVLCFVIINRVLFNLLCLWILFYNTSSQFCLDFFVYEQSVNQIKSVDVLFYVCSQQDDIRPERFLGLMSSL